MFLASNCSHSSTMSQVTKWDLASPCSRKGKVLVKDSFPSPLRPRTYGTLSPAGERFPKYTLKFLIPATCRNIFIPWGPFPSQTCRDKTIKAPANVHSILDLLWNSKLLGSPIVNLKSIQQPLVNLKFYNSLIYSKVFTWNRSQHITCIFSLLSPKKQNWDNCNRTTIK